MKQVQVGCAGIIFRPDGKFLIGKRKGSQGEGTWALPGGHLEFGESFEACVSRETEEETGLVIPASNFKYFYAVNAPMPADNKHYVTVFLRADLQETEPKAMLMEPNKCEGWAWVSLKDLEEPNTPYSPLYFPFADLIERNKEQF
ncbi:hypothetical protein K7432_002790 [Basidiobolus ranarum]|uniref:Nudix hydrolase domain-containing protein n=1 Tax=Basidiobolus ranarum TaxID=34480 RepID=A0ABR2X113_9FUNG